MTYSDRSETGRQSLCAFLCLRHFVSDQTHLSELLEDSHLPRNNDFRSNTMLVGNQEIPGALSLCKITGSPRVSNAAPCQHTLPLPLYKSIW
jgi:hypothetical protein